MFWTELFGLALAVALSPLSIIPGILMLFTARPRATGTAFLGGWLVGLTGVTGVSVLLAGIIEFAYGTPTWALWVRLLIGVALVGLGVKKWLQRAEKVGAPAWMDQISGYGPGQAARTGLLLAVANPKVLVFCGAAGVAIGSAELGVGPSLGLTLAFAVTAALSVALPVLAYAVSGERLKEPLRRTKEWLERHNAVLMATLFVVIGLLLVNKAVTGLL